MADKKAADAEIPADIKKMSFEDALAELEEIVAGLEQGAGKLDQAISAYERGTALKSHCEAKLQDARTRIEKITVAADSKLDTESFDAE